MAEPEKLKLTVQDATNGRRHPVSISPGTTVKALKDALVKKTIIQSDQVLSVNGKQLSEGSTLKEAGVGDGAVLMVTKQASMTGA